MNDDTIYRQAAIDIVEYECGKWRGLAKTIVKEIEQLQSARPKGKWIIKDNPGTGWYRITCSECGEDVTSEAPCIGFFPNAKVAWDFCPYCGSDNREVKE